MTDSNDPTTEQDVEGHRLAGNDTEVVVEDGEPSTEQDVEGHRLAGNDTEIVVEDD